MPPMNYSQLVSVTKKTYEYQCNNGRGLCEVKHNDKIFYNIIPMDESKNLMTLKEILSTRNAIIELLAVTIDNIFDETECDE
jgi:hypothetical protein